MTAAKELIQEVVSAHQDDKDGALLVEDLASLYLSQSPEGRKALLDVYRDWILSNDLIKSDWSISLIQKLGLVDEIPLLEGVLHNVRIGKSNLPKYYEQFLVPAIKELRMRKENGEG